MSCKCFPFVIKKIYTVWCGFFFSIKNRLFFIEKVVRVQFFWLVQKLQTIKYTFMNSTSKVILAIVGAAAAGAIIGMLVAPEKGSDLRKRISDATNDWSNQLGQLLAQGKEQLENLKSTATSETENLTGEAQERYNKVREKVS
jgi:gas vesicle protein